MHKPLLILILLFSTTFMSVFSQGWTYRRSNCVVSLNEKGQVITTCDIVRPNDLVVTQAFVGSDFFCFPSWQNGTVDLGENTNTVSCQVAFNLVTNEVLCRTDSTTQGIAATPSAFTIGDYQFISRESKVLGKKVRAYYLVLYDGKTKLLKNEIRQFNNTIGYQSSVKYYLEKSNNELVQVQPASKSFLTNLNDQAESLRAKTHTKYLTEKEMIGLVDYYDSLSEVVK